jgi:ribosomal protein L16 Arg81 hydroxylase
VETYEIVLEAGDIMYLPPWTWHRVDYIPDVTALSVSFFHVRYYDLLMQNPLFASTIVPNMVKELVGWKTQ